MRQLVKAAAVLAGMLAFSASGFAQCKIVVVNMNDAVTGSNEGKAGATKYDARADEWKAKLKKIQDDLDALQTKRKQQQALGSQSALADLDKQIADKNTALMRMSEDAQKDVDEYRDQLLAPVMMTAQAALDAMGTEKNYSLIYDISAPNSPIIYSSKECNVTEDLMKRMNAKAAPAPPNPKPGDKAPEKTTDKGPKETLSTSPKPPAGPGSNSPATTTPKPAAPKP